MRITAVTVTYGNRWELLRSMLHAAFSEGMSDAVIADNASEDDIAARAAQEFPGRTHTLRLDRNTGSAGGFAAAVREAMQLGAEYLLLLDDDNELQPGFLDELANAYNGIAQCDRSYLCLLGARQRMISSASRNSICKNCFLGFSLSELPSKVGRRLFSRWAPKPEVANEGPLISLKMAPYGGLFFHRSIIDRFGYPNEEMVLYQDDLEFTHRITSQGGQIWQVTGAQIRDLEQSWFLQRQRRTSMEDWLETGSDRQVFYTVRNRIYLELLMGKPTLGRTANKAFYLMLLWSVAILRGRLQRYRLILRAIDHGEAGTLGIDPDLPLTVQT